MRISNRELARAILLNQRCGFASLLLTDEDFDEEAWLDYHDERKALKRVQRYRRARNLGKSVRFARNAALGNLWRHYTRRTHVTTLTERPCRCAECARSQQSWSM